MSSPNIVKNASEGYGYKYSSLADLAKAGVEIPAMKTALVDGQEYVFAKIGDEWIQGAKVVDVDMKGMNAAQAYGSALTYARRYTVQLVLGIACDDDDKLEAHSAADREKFSKSKSQNGIDFQAIRDQCKLITDLSELVKYHKEFENADFTDKQRKAVDGIFSMRRKELEK